MKKEKVEGIKKQHLHMPIKCDHCGGTIGTGASVWIVRHKKKKRHLARLCSNACLVNYIGEVFE